MFVRTIPVDSSIDVLSFTILIFSPGNNSVECLLFDVHEYIVAMNLFQLV